MLNIRNRYNRTNNARTNVSNDHATYARTVGAGTTFSFPMFNNMNTDNLSPVIIRPTDQQIRNATEIINYSHELENTICPITQFAFEEDHDIRRIIHCGHCFMNESLMNWFTRSTICPLCRYDIREYNISTISHSDEDIDHTVSDYVNDNDDFPTTIPNHTTVPTPITPTTPTTPTTLTTVPTHTTVPTPTTPTNIPSPTTNSDIEGFFNTFTNQISDSFSTHLMNSDLSFNQLDNRGVNIEYTIQTPHNIFTLSSTTSSLGDIFRENNTSIDTNTDNDNNDDGTDNDNNDDGTDNDDNDNDNDNDNNDDNDGDNDGTDNDGTDNDGTNNDDDDDTIFNNERWQ